MVWQLPRFSRVAARFDLGFNSNKKLAVSVIDRASKRGLHHKNKSARLKSRMNARIKAMA
jgi:ribosomal protein S20